MLVLTEISKLPKEYFSKIDAAVLKSNFWKEDNDPESMYSGHYGSLQTPAARALEKSLQGVFDDLGLDMDVLVSSMYSDDENFQLNPGHPAYPNRWLVDARWYVSKKRP